jgi:hypothetical protein
MRTVFPFKLARGGALNSFQPDRMLAHAVKGLGLPLRDLLSQVLIISKLQNNMSWIRVQTCTKNTNVAAGVLPRGLAKISLGESVTYQSQNHLTITFLAQVLIISKLQHNMS